MVTTVLTAAWAVAQFIWGTVAAVRIDCYFHEVRQCEEEV